MNEFGFVVGITLMSTLFIFDILVTKYSTRASKWGIVLGEVLQDSPQWKFFGICCVVLLWITAFLFGNFITKFQVILSIAYCSWMIITFVVSTIFYYSDMKE